MKFKPQQRVKILPLDCFGRIDRCILDGGPQPIYNVCFYIESTQKQNEFYEDELEEMK